MLYFATRENRLGFIFKYNIKFHKALKHLLLKPEATRSERPCVIIKMCFPLFFLEKSIKSRGRDKYFGHARQTGVDRQTPQQPLDVRGSV